MAEDIECGLTIREEVDQNLSGELIDRMRNLIEAQRDETVFRDRLVHVLTRYQRYLAVTKTVMRKERRKQISALLGKAQGFLVTMEALHPEVRQSLESVLDANTLDDRWEGYDFFDLDQPIPSHDDTLDQAQSMTRKIIEACHLELDLLDESKSDKRGSRKPSLDQLLIDLAGLFEAETEQPAASNCYRDETSKDAYNGKFFNMAKTLLDEIDPGSYDTSAALGIRILRVI
ncbi:hypothetical protein RUE5091_03059 [Ruegeria denitrificans]|uniref:Uncharacterized protein n=1 Tax=Ruegeria denitrificans TaxID=1715692 RepID=A0A0P1IEI9_9RHOB|nr:hypothetical protein [Ruegeria denitrificans]CUK08273.1 hypothetical protein RUE5091_03059 [Ruegeria denitrificans]